MIDSKFEKLLIKNNTIKLVIIQLMIKESVMCIVLKLNQL